MKVSQLLAKKAGPVQSVAPEEMVHGVAKILKEMKIGLVVVCGSDGAIVGVLSERLLCAVSPKRARRLWT